MLSQLIVIVFHDANSNEGLCWETDVLLGVLLALSFGC